MKEKVLKVEAKNGLHARPAAQIVGIVNKYKSEATLYNSEAESDARSIMGLMMLFAPHGTELTIRADGKDEDQLIEELSLFFENRFNEE